METENGRCNLKFCFQEVSLCGAPSSFTTVNATKAYGSTERSFRYKKGMELVVSRYIQASKIQKPTKFQFSEQMKYLPTQVWELLELISASK